MASCVIGSFEESLSMREELASVCDGFETELPVLMSVCGK